MKWPAASAIGLLLAASACSRAPVPRPNVVFIVMDTTRGDRCGWNGYDRPTTPQLDRFALDSVAFREAWSPAGWTGPSHASMFTGLRTEHHGFLEGNRPFLEEEATTLAEHFVAAGYRTACYSNNWVVSPEFGLTQGCELYEPRYKAERHGTPARETHTRALAWATARAAAKEPFFLFINDIEPHLPYEPEGAIAAPFLRDSPTEAELAAAMAFNHPSGVGYILGVVEVDDRRMRLLSDLYDGELAALDAELGRLLDGLEGAGLLDDTIVVITGDHGEHFGEHGLMDHKFSLHRTLVRVPLLIRYPGRFSGGQVVDDPVRLEDIAPTLLELTGQAIPTGMDGETLTRDLPGREVRGAWGIWARHEDEFKRLFPGADTAPLYTSIRSIYDGRHHYIRYSDGREELYHVATDPNETNDLMASEPAIALRLRARLEQP